MFIYILFVFLVIKGDKASEFSKYLRKTDSTDEVKKNNSKI